MIEISILLLSISNRKNYEQTEQIFDQVFCHPHCAGNGLPRTGYFKYQFSGSLQILDVSAWIWLAVAGVQITKPCLVSLLNYKLMLLS
jgi:hypothetical protein